MTFRFCLCHPLLPEAVWKGSLGNKGFISKVTGSVVIDDACTLTVRLFRVFCGKCPSAADWAETGAGICGPVEAAFWDPSFGFLRAEVAVAQWHPPPPHHLSEEEMKCGSHVTHGQVNGHTSADYVHGFLSIWKKVDKMSASSVATHWKSHKRHQLDQKSAPHQVSVKFA